MLQVNTTFLYKRWETDPKSPNLDPWLPRAQKPRVPRTPAPAPFDPFAPACIDQRIFKCHCMTSKARLSIQPYAFDPSFGSLDSVLDPKAVSTPELDPTLLDPFDTQLPNQLKANSLLHLKVQAGLESLSSTLISALFQPYRTQGSQTHTLAPFGPSAGIGTHSEPA